MPLSSAPHSNSETIRALTVEEFSTRQATLACCNCLAVGYLQSALVPNTNHLRIDCGNCFKQHALGRIIFLKQSTKKIRKEYPMGESVEEVWARFDNHCTVCGAPKDFLNRAGIKCERHHVLEYVKNEHAGPIVPMCGPCHTNTTERQKLFWFWFRRTGASE